MRSNTDPLPNEPWPRGIALRRSASGREGAEAARGGPLARRLGPVRSAGENEGCVDGSARQSVNAARAGLLAAHTCCVCSQRLVCALPIVRWALDCGQGRRKIAADRLASRRFHASSA